MLYINFLVVCLSEASCLCEILLVEYYKMVIPIGWSAYISNLLLCNNLSANLFEILNIWEGVMYVDGIKEWII